jgi:hypothetical protein
MSAEAAIMVMQTVVVVEQTFAVERVHAMGKTPGAEISDPRRAGMAGTAAESATMSTRSAANSAVSSPAAAGTDAPRRSRGRPQKHKDQET